jgi:hypothetical protein
MVNGAKKTMTGVANVTPSAGQVGKFMGKNLGAAAVVGAVDLLLDGVDWVIDEGGKVTKKPSAESLLCSPNLQTCYEMAGGVKRGTPEAVCSVFNKRNGTVYHSATANTCYYSNNGKKAVLSTIYQRINSSYNPSAPPIQNETIKDKEGKPLTLTSLGQMVIDQAQEEIRTGNPAVPIATPVTQAAATAVVGEAATDEAQARPIAAELDKSAAIPTDETATGEIAPPTTNPDTGEVKPGSISLDFPVFCSWAPSMCVLADKVQEAITDAREWVKESEQTDTELEFPEQEQQETDTNINFNGSCPAKITLVNFNYHGNQQNWEVDFSEWCSAVTTYIKPIVISMGAFSAVLIVSGVRINE